MIRIAIFILMMLLVGCEKKPQCKHTYGKVESNYQYCVTCNTAKPIPCGHKWKEKDQYTRTYGGLPVGHGYISVCEKCGEHKDFFVDALKR